MREKKAGSEEKQQDMISEKSDLPEYDIPKDIQANDIEAKIDENNDSTPTNVENTENTENTAQQEDNKASENTETENGPKTGSDKPDDFWHDKDENNQQVDKVDKVDAQNKNNHPQINKNKDDQSIKSL